MSETKEVTLEVPESVSMEQLRRAVEVAASQNDDADELRREYDRGHGA